MSDLLHSRKFLLLTMDAVISIILYFVSHYAGGVLDDIKFLILTLQPVIVAVIWSFTKEDVARINADALMKAAEYRAGGDRSGGDRSSGGASGE